MVFTLHHISYLLLLLSIKNDLALHCMNYRFLVPFILTGLLACNSLYSQQQKNNRTADSIRTNQLLLNQEKNVLRSALNYQDYSAATNALYHLMELDDNKTIWKDSLCIIYFKIGAYQQCLTIASELFSGRPADQRLMAIIAFSEKNLGMIKEALDMYEKLYPLTKDVYDLYEIAGIQFSLKRLGECENSLNKLISAADSERTTINLSYDGNLKQIVSVKSAALNLKGALMQELNKKQDAIHYFEEALKLEPGFMLAKKNLQLLQAKQQN
jgi:tetratricopeptide (TPR) repeat protein